MVVFGWREGRGAGWPPGRRGLAGTDGCAARGRGERGEGGRGSGRGARDEVYY
jgi:hypothetical protein